MNVIIDKSLNEATGSALEQPWLISTGAKEVADAVSFLVGIHPKNIYIKISYDDKSMINEPHEGDLLITTIKDESGDPETALLKAEPIQEDPEQVGWYRLW